MGGPAKLVDHRQPVEPVAGRDEQRGIARKGDRIARHGGDPGHIGAGKLAPPAPRRRRGAGRSPPRRSLLNSSGSSGRRNRSRTSVVTRLRPVGLAPAGIERGEHPGLALDGMDFGRSPPAAARRCRCRQTDRRSASRRAHGRAHPGQQAPPRPPSWPAGMRPAAGRPGPGPKSCAGGATSAIDSPSQVRRARPMLCRRAAASAVSQRRVERLAAGHGDVRATVGQGHVEPQRRCCARRPVPPGLRARATRRSGRGAAGGSRVSG